MHGKYACVCVSIGCRYFRLEFQSRCLTSNCELVLPARQQSLNLPAALLPDSTPALLAGSTTVVLDHIRQLDFGSSSSVGGSGGGRQPIQFQVTKLVAPTGLHEELVFGPSCRLVASG